MDARRLPFPEHTPVSRRCQVNASVLTKHSLAHLEIPVSYTENSVRLPGTANGHSHLQATLMGPELTVPIFNHHH